MQEFMRKFQQLNGVRAKVVLDHCLFDRQTFDCDELQTLNDDDKVGLTLKNREIFMYKHDVKVVEQHNNKYVISDGRLRITVIVNNL